MGQDCFSAYYNALSSESRVLFRGYGGMLPMLHFKLFLGKNRLKISMFIATTSKKDANLSEGTGTYLPGSFEPMKGR